MIFLRTIVKKHVFLHCNKQKKKKKKVEEETKINKIRNYNELQLKIQN